MSQLQNILENVDQLLAFESKKNHTWCSGCGNYGILSGIKRALALQNYQPDQVMFCFDVGCGGNANDKINAYTIHGLHGRVLSLASGIALANPKIKVLATAGDGATLSEGINHLCHAIRNDYPVTFILHNNANYALTIGQSSSTTRPGHGMNGSIDGNLGSVINVLQLALSLNPTFVARTFSGDIEHISQTIEAGLKHPGFALIEVLQACPTFNKVTPQEWYWDKIRYIENDKIEASIEVSKDLNTTEINNHTLSPKPKLANITNYDNTDIWQARKIVENLDTEIALGIIYQKPNLIPAKYAPHREDISTTLVEEVRNFNIAELMQEFV